MSVNGAYLFKTRLHSLGEVNDNGQSSQIFNSSQSRDITGT